MCAFNRFLFCFFLLCWTASSYAAKNFSYQISSTQTAITENNDLLSATWQAHNPAPFFLPAKKTNDWLKVEITNHSAEEQTYFIQLSDSELPSIQAYILDEQSALSAYYPSLGLDHPFIDRPIQYRRVVYPLQIEAGQSGTLYLEIQHAFSIKVHPNIWDAQSFQHFANSELLFFGVLYGALSMIIIYSLFIYTALRERSYLLFLLFGIFTGFFIAMQEGHFYQFIETQKTWPKEGFLGLISALMCLSFTFLTSTFLHLQHRMRLASRIIIFIGCTIALFLFLLGLNKQAIILSHFTLAVISLLYSSAITVAFILWYVRQSRSALFFALAISVCNIGLLHDFSTKNASLTITLFNYGYASIGNTAMILVFAFALAYKMRVMQQEQIDSAKKLVQLSEEKTHNYIEHLTAEQQKNLLQQKANEATIKNRAKSEFIANMSSDVRTPMNSILGLGELLIDTPLDKKQQHYADSIISSAKSLLNVINGLVDYSQIQVGQLTIDTRVFNLEKLIDDCVSIFALSASEEKLYFTGMVTPDTGIQYRGDADKIRQIILNLLSNAFRFEKITGVSLRVSKTERTTINSQELIFEVVCHNVVLSQKDQAELLTVYENKKNKSQSNNLGLTVSLELLELMQGKIAIDVNEEEHYSVLSFSLRLLIPSKEDAMELPNYSKWLNGRRMLICDPHPLYSKSLKIQARTWGIESVICANVNDAIQILFTDEQPFHLLMIAEEYLSPELHMALRKNNVDRNFSTAIILTTRTRYAFSAEEMKKQNIQFILEKPWTAKQLYTGLLVAMGVNEGEENKAEENDSPPLHALLVEDDNINLMVMEGLLKKLQIDVTSTRNGKEAFSLYQQTTQPFDVIFMDCEMPIQDGYTTSRAIRQAEDKSQQKSVIIGLSAHSDNEYREKALLSGMDEFIAKPINLDNLAAIIENVKSGHFTRQNKELLDDSETST